MLIGNILCGVIIAGLSFNLLVFLFKIKEWYFEALWKWFIKTDLFRENYTVEHLELSAEYEKIDKEMLGKTGNRSEFVEATKVEQLDGLAELASTHVKTTKNKLKPLRLRPSETEVVRKDIT